MKKRYNFSDSKSNPYLQKRTRQITIRLDESTIDCFKSFAEGTGIPYQT